MNKTNQIWALGAVVIAAASTASWGVVRKWGNEHYFPPAQNFAASSMPPGYYRMQSWLPATRLEAADFTGERNFVLPIVMRNNDDKPFTPLGKSQLPGMLVGDKRITQFAVIKDGAISRVSITGLRMVDSMPEAKEIIAGDIATRSKELDQKKNDKTIDQSGQQLLSVNNVYILHNPRMCNGELYVDAWIDPVREQNMSHFKHNNGVVLHRASFAERLDRVPEMMSSKNMLEFMGQPSLPVYTNVQAMGLQGKMVNHPLEIIAPAGVSFVGLMGLLTFMSARGGRR